jgi:hypothetical protein
VLGAHLLDRSPLRARLRNRVGKRTELAWVDSLGVLRLDRAGDQTIHRICVEINRPRVSLRDRN